MPPTTREASLLPDSQNTNTTASRIIHWVTTVGRFVIVFTELIVISAFLSRFYLDRKNADLSEIVRQQKAILESTKDFESEYILLQQRLSTINDFFKKSQDLTTPLNTLTKSTPPEIVFTRLSLSDGEQSPKVTLSVNSLNETAIVDFITNLSLNPQIESINVRKIEKKPKDFRYWIDLDIVFKGEANGNTKS